MAPKLSDNDVRMLQLVWQCFTSQPTVDYDKLAALGGYKNKASATTAFSNLKKKLALVCGGGDTSAKSQETATKSKKRTAPAAEGPKKRGKKAKVEIKRDLESGGEDDAEEDVKTEKSINGGDGDEDEI